jgi:DNA-binding MarR family transcriptional regulator
MSRGGRDDVRSEAATREPDRSEPAERASRRRDLPHDRLALPRADRREPVEFRDGVYHLRGSESRILATVGAFRVVPAADLADGRVTPEAFKEDLRRLDDQGLIERRTLPINREPTRVVVLTKTGKALLDAHRDPSIVRQQQYHAGLVKPRELPHDAQLYRLYQAEAAELEARGGRVERVVLDYELKREYQSFLNRPDRPEDVDRDEEIAAFAADHRLPIIDDHLELPDLRIEFETADGRLEVRDLELVTEHYSRGQLSGKARAGFGLYRAAGAGRLRGGNARTGGTPFDPHHLVRL